MKKIFILIIFILSITGCNNYSDLNELAIIKSIGISHNDNYTLYAEIIEEIDKDNNPKMTIYEVNGKSINELFQNIKKEVNKEIYLSHIDLLLLDFNLNNQDFKNINDYFLNHNEFRNDFLCVISKDIKTLLENSKYDEIEELIETNKENKDIIRITYEDIIKDLIDYHKFIVSNVEYKNNKIKFLNNYQYQNNKFERILNESKKN